MKSTTFAVRVSLRTARVGRFPCAQVSTEHYVVTAETEKHFDVRACVRAFATTTGIIDSWRACVGVGGTS